MDELLSRARALQSAIADALQRIGFEQLQARKTELDTIVAAPDFWNTALAAQTAVKEQSSLEKRLQPWVQIRQSVNEAVELLGLGDPSLVKEVAAQVQVAEDMFVELKEELKFSGPYDEHDVIISLHAGAGGSDAQDWAGMLLRMYVRWAEQQIYSVTMLDEAAADEGGIKSATLEITGVFAYGKLKSEHGVHRLVRLSPFNA
ncbi:MAG: PCRF domain-containing protein, partial [Candidatus Saccharimonadales bacterium]